MTVRLLREPSPDDSEARRSRAVIGFFPDGHPQQRPGAVVGLDAPADGLMPGEAPDGQAGGHGVSMANSRAPLWPT